MAANLKEKAIVYWQRAGSMAVRRSANKEAISHLTTGLELLKALPDSAEHAQQELTMLRNPGRSTCSQPKAFRLPRSKEPSPERANFASNWARYHSFFR